MLYIRLLVSIKQYLEKLAKRKKFWQLLKAKETSDLLTEYHNRLTHLLTDFSVSTILFSMLYLSKTEFLVWSSPEFWLEAQSDFHLHASKHSLL